MEKTYLIVHEDGTEKKITVPDDWKVTFGPAVKGGNGKHNNFKMPMALRFYESENKQRAIFTDVVSFRDTSIKIVEKRVNVQEKEGFFECEGIKKQTIFQARTTEWIDPDKVVEERVQLPSDSSIFDFDED